VCITTHNCTVLMLFSMVQWLLCLLLDLRFVESDLAEDDGFLREIKICSMTSFREEVKPMVPCRKILRHFKDLYSMKEMLVGQIHRHFLPSFSYFATRYLC
jgi:hypothetical protein